MNVVKKRLILCGFGNVGRAFANLVAERHELVKKTYGLELEVIAVVDIGGAAVSNQNSIPIDQLLAHVEKGGMVETFAGHGRPDMTGSEVIAEAAADILVEITPTNLTDGEPGWSHMQAALASGLDIVSANKGPLVLYYREILDLAKENGCRIYMSAATAAALPTLDVGLLCLAGSQVKTIEGILNGTTNYILTRMHLEKCTFETALKAAQRLGIAETDPTLDVEGLDTRNKILVIANRIFGENFGLEDIPVTGISKITAEDIDRALAADKIIKLVGTGAKKAGQVTLRVEPKALDRDHPLAGINYSEKGISYLTDTMGRVTVTGGKSSPVGAAAALLKDLIHSFLFSASL